MRLNFWVASFLTLAALAWFLRTQRPGGAAREAQLDSSSA
jgi:hypothetical protein